VAGAAIGYGTNLLAIRMLFHPHRELRFLGRAVPFTPGLIPRERGKIAETIAESIEREFLSGEELVGLLKDSSIKRQAVRTIEDLVDDKLKPFPLPETLRHPIKLILSREVVKQIDAFFEERAHHVAESLDVKGAIVSKLNRMDLAELESLVYGVAGRQLRRITVFGGFLGFLIGCAQALAFRLAG
jgi:uncharacterized membrane protein YheB (UPF0754 family)